MKLLHTCLRVKDLDASLDFYINKLKMKEIRRTELAQAKATLVFVGYDEKEGTIELTYNHGREEPYIIGDGFSHVAIAVDDVKKTHDSLVAQGVTSHRAPVRMETGRTIAFVKDPDGYSIELLERNI